MKCEICKNKVAMNFLEKPIGMYVKDKRGRKHVICRDCQKNYENNKGKILEHL